MTFEPASVSGSFVVQIEPVADERGFFARTWCRREFAAQGMDIEMVQSSISHNRLAGTLRGLHFSLAPAREAKLVRCERGKLLDVIVDLRPDSPTFLEKFVLELDAELGNALFIPSGVAHGFQTLVPHTDVVYMMSDYYRADLADGYRYDDPAFGITWPLPIAAIAARDLGYADFDRLANTARVAATPRG